MIKRSLSKGYSGTPFAGAFESEPRFHVGDIAPSHRTSVTAALVAVAFVAAMLQAISAVACCDRAYADSAAIPSSVAAASQRAAAGVVATAAASVASAVPGAASSSPAAQLAASSLAPASDVGTSEEAGGKKYRIAFVMPDDDGNLELLEMVEVGYEQTRIQNLDGAMEAERLAKAKKQGFGDPENRWYWSGWCYRDMLSGSKAFKKFEDEYSVKTLDFHARNPSVSNDTDQTGSVFYLYPNWQPNYFWNTQFHTLCRDGDGWALETFGDERSQSYLRKRDYAATGEASAAIWFPVPGFEYGTPASLERMRSAYKVQSDKELPAKLTAALGPQETTFDVYVTAKQGYQVSYDLNDGDSSDSDHPASPGDSALASYQPLKDLDYGSKGVIPDKDPVRPGYTFKGWYTGKVPANETDEAVQADLSAGKIVKAESSMRYGDLTFRYDEAKKASDWYDPMTSDGGNLTLYARWTQDEHVVSYSIDSDSAGRGYLSWNTADATPVTSTEESGALSESVMAATGLAPDGSALTGAAARAKRGYTLRWDVLSTVGPITQTVHDVKVLA